MLTIARTSGVFGATAGTISARAPALAGVTNKVPCLLQRLGVGGEFCGQRAVNVPSLLQSPDVLPRQDSAPRGAASWRVAKGEGETDPLSSNTVECWSLDYRIPISTRMGKTLIVGDAEENVGRLCARQRTGEGDAEEGCKNVSHSDAFRD